jgi:hypothetical protein
MFKPLTIRPHTANEATGSYRTLCCRMRPAAFRTTVRVVRRANLILAGQNAYAFRPSFTRFTLSPVSRGALPFAPLGFRLHRDAG